MSNSARTDVEFPLERLVQRAIYGALLRHGERIDPDAPDAPLSPDQTALLKDLPASSREYMRLYRLSLPEHQRKQLLRVADRENWVRVRYQLALRVSRRDQHVHVNRVHPKVRFGQEDTDIPFDRTDIHSLLAEEKRGVPCYARLAEALHSDELLPWVFPKTANETERADLLRQYVEATPETWPHLPWKSDPGAFGQFVYRDFSRYEIDKDKKFGGVLCAGSALYSADLEALRYKHGTIIDGSDASEKKHQYRIYDNIRAVSRDPAFFSKMMQDPDVSKGREPLLPVLAYVLDGHLCSHDHKRIVASLAGGQRYLPCVVSQKQDLISVRLSAHHWFKALFSREEKSIIMFVQGTQLYWLVGPQSDSTTPEEALARPFDPASENRKELEVGVFYDVLESRAPDSVLLDHFKHLYLDRHIHRERERRATHIKMEEAKFTKTLQKHPNAPVPPDLSRARQSMAHLDTLIAQVEGLKTPSEALLWEGQILGNSLWYLRELPFLRPTLEALLNRYPDLSVCVDEANPPHLAPTKHIRYGKTPWPWLEQLVLCLRTAHLCGLYSGEEDTAPQAYTLEQLRAFQKRINGSEGSLPLRNGKKEPYHYLGELLSFYYEGTDEDGLLTEDVLSSILSLQKDDHRRILTRQIVGVVHYGAMQGLIQTTRYEHLLTPPRAMRFVIHLTKPASLTRQILNREPTERAKSDEEVGCLVLLGRYLHSLGHASLEIPQRMSLDRNRWPETRRLRRRFADRVAIGVDLEEVRKHYNVGCGEEEKACFGINEVGTVIFLRPVPNAALMGIDEESGEIRHASEGVRLREIPIKEVFYDPQLVGHDESAADGGSVASE
uniref:Uncharacterized protein n=1 Tax=Chromera velia CCMP2878 TaxID=1169474 RepID=A0A0G4HDT1_9ALVE|eukprot:Cvel_26584.t1-p1 / transcript=Cvel_26584.t1 / gene=Cvel_26584 / organism=Chromera_velia_CCMP2878 / gene_product=hypothetical protein / transcript_product=hypothetical protein / location=Cvel_scaffold3183:12779-15289(-) / protein_length=837 / sequence_SO=supercontig / SO=protein_coding / is_pseudo=false